MNTALEGRVAIVTGSSRGIGEAIAQEFVDRGASVVVSSHEADPATSVADRLRAQGGRVIDVVADVTRPEQIQNLVNQTVATMGRLDILVNNAGVGAVSPSEALSIEQWRHTLDVNLTGPFLCSQAAAKVMIDQGQGVIVNIASIFGAVGMPLRAAYASSKHGLIGLTKVLGTEWAQKGIRVVAVHPAYGQTALDDADQETGDYTVADIEGRTPMGRYGNPAEIARVVAFLVSDAASFITGSCIDVDGGWLAYGGW